MGNALLDVIHSGQGQGNTSALLDAAERSGGLYVAGNFNEAARVKKAGAFGGPIVAVQSKMMHVGRRGPVFVDNHAIAVVVGDLVGSVQSLEASLACAEDAAEEAKINHRLAAQRCARVEKQLSLTQLSLDYARTGIPMDIAHALLVARFTDGPPPRLVEPTTKLYLSTEMGHSWLTMAELEAVEAGPDRIGNVLIYGRVYDLRKREHTQSLLGFLSEVVALTRGLPSPLHRMHEAQWEALVAEMAHNNAQPNSFYFNRCAQGDGGTPIDRCWSSPGHKGDHACGDPVGTWPRRPTDTCAPEEDADG